MATVTDQSMACFLGDRQECAPLFLQVGASASGTIPTCGLSAPPKYGRSDLKADVDSQPA